MIASGKVKNQAEFTNRNVIKLDKNIVDSIEKKWDTMDRKVISERELRKITFHN